jgi:hypothetical protein
VDFRMSAIDKLFTLKDRAFLHAHRISRPTATVEVAGRRLTFKTDTVAGTKAIKDSDERPNIEWLANRATGTFWDIGANRGLFSAAVPCRTISFEPDIRLHPELSITFGGTTLTASRLPSRLQTLRIGSH